MTLDLWARLLIFLAAVGWGSTVILVWSARAMAEAALTERAVAGVILSTAASIFAVLAAAFLFSVTLAPGTVTAALITIALLLNAPQIVWAAAALTRRFR